MANEVYANGREVACKAAAGKTIAAFPDTCLSPPSPPAGPVPIPYPNTACASDTTKGSTTVMISGQEVMLKDQSTFSKSTGDEAATKSLGMGVVTHTIQGEASFVSWSMDVKFEGQNADRHLDQTLHNEQCVPANTPTWPYIDKNAIANGTAPCKDERDKERTACEPVEKGVAATPMRASSRNKATREAYCGNKECNEARKCMLQPYAPEKSEGQAGCCDGKTPHHVIAAHCFMPPGTRAAGGSARYAGCEGYDVDAAPCICVSGEDKSAGDHKVCHDIFDDLEDSNMKDGKAGSWPYKDAAAAGALAAEAATGCSSACLEAQLNAYHQQKAPQQPSMSDDTQLRADSHGTRTPEGFVPSNTPDAVGAP
jgi:uncharacterized protein DUF4150/HNH/endonuclease VII toxin of polymorphic toxin system